MSDPMTNTEIEDVLSSIRRLVSEDLRPNARGAAVAEQPLQRQEPEKTASAKLILTPALRVVSNNQTDVEPALPLSVSAPEPTVRSGVDDLTGAEQVADSFDSVDVVSRLGAAVQGDDEWESPVGDLDTFEQAKTVSPLVEAAPPQAPIFGRPEPLGSRLHLSRPLGEEEDFLSEPAAPAVVEDVAPELTETVEEDARPAFVPLRRAAPPADDDWADAAEAEVRAELEKGIEEEAVSSVYAAPEATFDEEVLRDLVRDIIREELAGSLGERITRNVRKLVRAEIARALAVREFE